MAVGVGMALFSIVAEGIGLGSGNGTFGAWQKAGVAVGLVAIVAGASWCWPPSRWRSRSLWAINGPVIVLGAGLVIALAAVVPLFVGFSDDPIDTAMSCGELETAKREARSDYGADNDAFTAEVLPRYHDRKWELGCLGLEL
jgi:hypothetical protein